MVVSAVGRVVRRVAAFALTMAWAIISIGWSVGFVISGSGFVPFTIIVGARAVVLIALISFAVVPFPFCGTASLASIFVLIAGTIVVVVGLARCIRRRVTVVASAIPRVGCG